MGEELNQEKVDFVTVGIGMLLPAQVMNQQSAQSFVAAGGRGLQELAKLMHLNAGVHVQKQLPGLFDGFLGRGIHGGFEIAVRWQIEHEFPSQRGI